VGRIPPPRPNSFLYLLLNKQRVKPAQCCGVWLGPHLTVTQSSRVWRRTSTVNCKPNVTWFGLSPKSNAFIRGPCAAFPPNFVKISRVYLRNPANKQTNKQTKWTHNLLGGGKKGTFRSRNLCGIETWLYHILLTPKVVYLHIDWHRLGGQLHERKTSCAACHIWVYCWLFSYCMWYVIVVNRLSFFLSFFLSLSLSLSLWLAVDRLVIGMQRWIRAASVCWL